MADHDPVLIDRTARAIYEADGGDVYDRESPACRDRYREMARAVFDAVADDLRAKALQKAVERMESFFGNDDPAHDLAQKYLRGIASDYRKGADRG